MMSTPPASPAAPRSEATAEPLYVPFKRAVEISGLGRSTLYRSAMDGRLRLVKAGRTTLVCYTSLKALLDGLPAARLRDAA